MAARITRTLSGLTMRRPTFSITQYLSLVVVLGAAFALHRYSNHAEFIWRNDTLRYSTPEIPVEFDQNGRGKPLMIFSVSSEPIEYENGGSLYLQCHRGGWEHCRKRFYSEHVITDGPHEISDSLPANKWIFDHQLSAINDGYDKCCSQLQHLRMDYSKKQLASKIGYSVNWIRTPLLFVFFAGLFAMAIFRPKNAR